jgi:hypothetical protein
VSFVTCDDLMVVITPDGSTLFGCVHEAGGHRLEGQMFTVIVGGGWLLHFLGPPDHRGWWEGGCNGHLRQGFYCTRAPSAFLGARSVGGG